MQYLLMIHADEKAYGARPADEQKRSFEAYMAYAEALKKAGAFVGSNRLRPTGDATTVRITNGKTQVLDGPYVETKEQLGGYFLIDAPDLDAAIAWAARCPGAEHGTMEVRPIWIY
jgi:hypothetical protein